MPAPLAAAVVAAIARAAVSNAAKKRLMQAAAKKVTEKEIKALIKTEMQTGAPKLGRAVRRPDVTKPPKRVVERRGSTGVRAEKKDPAKELYNLYKKKPDTKTVTKSMQKERVTPADVVAKRIAQKNERIRTGTKVSRISKPPKRDGMTEELRARQKALAAKRKTESADQARREAERTQNTSAIDKMIIRGREFNIENPGARAGRNPQSSIESRSPNLESRGELAAFGKLSKAELKNYNRIEARINEAIKASRKAERAAAKKKTSPSKRTK